MNMLRSTGHCIGKVQDVIERKFIGDRCQNGRFLVKGKLLFTAFQRGFSHHESCELNFDVHLVFHNGTRLSNGTPFKYKKSGSS